MKRARGGKAQGTTYETYVRETYNNWARDKNDWARCIVAKRSTRRARGRCGVRDDKDSGAEGEGEELDGEITSGMNHFRGDHTASACPVPVVIYSNSIQ